MIQSFILVFVIEHNELSYTSSKDMIIITRNQSFFSKLRHSYTI